MATKSIRFDMLENGSAFTYHLGGLTNDCIKTSTRKARVAANNVAEEPVEFAIKPSTMVTITVPDPPPPTAEEITERLQRRFDNRLWDFTRTHDLETFTNNFATNPLYAFQNCERAIKTAAQHTVATMLKQIAEHPGAEGGIDKAIAYARREAMQAIRHPRRSTSPVDNYVAQELRSAYAEFVEGF